MNPKFLLLPLGLAVSLAHAQTSSPIITAADMPAANDSLRLSQTATLPTNAPPLTRNGASQTWNYASLVATSQRVERYADASTAVGLLLQLTFNNPLSSDNRATLVAPRSLPLPAGTTFPVPITSPLEFVNGSAADFRSVGFGATYDGNAVPVTYASRAQQDIIYRFPLTFGNNADVSNSLLTTPALVASSGYFSQKRQRTNQPDAWGTLTTPFGTFQAVRVVTTLLDHDSLAVGGAPGQGLTLPLTRQYKWLAKGVHVPVLTITTTTVAGQEVVTGAEYRDSYRRLVPLATRGTAGGPEVGAAPNPSAVGTDLHLLVPAGSGPLVVQATDLLGRRVFSRAFGSSAGGVLTLEAAAFGSFRGVLLLAVQTAQGTSTRRVVRE